MVAIVTATGLVGLGASIALLALGVTSMPVRYALAVLVAYAVFLLLVRLWASRRLDADASSLDVPGPGGGPREGPTFGGGRFGGGGAGRGWEGGAVAPETTAAPSLSGVDVDLDEGWIVVVPVALLVGGVLAAAYIVYAAPVLFAEVLLDVALVSGLYRRLRTIEARSWLTTAIRHTWVPVTLVVLLVVTLGFVIQHQVPQADSIGDVLRP